MKRYDVDGKRNMVEESNGFYVLHSDHVADKEQAIAALQEKYDALTGEKFSDRNHTALKFRANDAEKKIAALQAQYDRLLSILESKIEVVAYLMVVLNKIANEPDESSEWDAVDKFALCKTLAGEALAQIKGDV